jgi:hypothetical protein
MFLLVVSAWQILKWNKVKNRKINIFLISIHLSKDVLRSQKPFFSKGDNAKMKRKGA